MMRRKKLPIEKILKAILLFFICICSCTSCKKIPAEQIEITLIHGWGTMDKDHVAMRSIYEDFEQKNPDIKINLVAMPSSEEVISKVNNMMSVGKIPDLIFTGGDGKDSLYRFMVDKGYAVDFIPYIEKDPEFAADLGTEVLDYWLTEEGELFSVSDVLLLSGGYWYNEDIFQAVDIKNPPKTWDEFFYVCEKIKKWAEESQEDIIPLQMNMENSVYLVDSLMMKEGGEGKEGLIDKQLIIKQEEFLNVLEDLKKVYEYSYVTSEDYGYRDVLRLFNASKQAMYINGVWANQMISPDINVSYATLPSKEGEPISCVSACLGFMVGNTGNQEKIDASVRFVKYMISDDVQERILEETGQVPSNPSIKLSEYEMEMPRLYQAVQTVQDADVKIEVPNNLWSNEKINIFYKDIMAVMKEEISDLHFIDKIK